MANSQLQIINDKLQQEGFNSSLMARRQEMRRRMADGNYDADQTDQATQPTELKSLSTNSEGGAPTLASTYGNLLNNYQATSSKLSNAFNGYSSNDRVNLPSWVSPAVNMGLGLSGHGDVGTIASGAMDAMSGNTAGAASKLASLFTSKLTEGKIPGLSGLISNLAGGLVAGQDGSTIAKNIGNSAIGTALGMANPVLGIGYGLARMFGLDPIRGFGNMLNPNENVPESWRGGFFDKGYDPEAGSWMSSGNNNYSPYGGSTTSQTYGSPDTGVGSGFNSAGWGMSSSSNNSSDSGGD